MESLVGLAALIRAWRDRAAPAGPTARGRRAPGLRREELAQRAGLSVDYIIRLEQGRMRHPSPQVLGAIARALGLSSDETELLYRVVGLAAPRGPILRQVPDSVSRLTERLAAFPVAVYSADWWLLRWNARWAALLGDPADQTGRNRNLVWQVFTDDRRRVLPADRPLAEFQQALTADLRIAVAEHPEDTRVTGLATALRAASPLFAQQWTAGHTARHRTERKRVLHPDLGELHLDCDVLQSPDPAVNILVYSAPPGSADAALLERVLA
ncbi:helix-turn-helix domain-containing protein [Streptomyces lushanensis]|uniref:helix-turn-helix domain-containing protein n=1 Tax=Streptomyces lushanensis TaxID=1434255 RepID=UPI0008312027|nr:helix-turn-helix domain-containing protein [Streptomyces lushanensis]